MSEIIALAAGKPPTHASFRRDTAKLAQLSAVLDQLAAAIFLVDSQGRIVYSNASGHRLLSAAVVVRNRGARLTAIDRAADRRLRELFAATCVSEHITPNRGAAVPLPASRNQDPRVAYVHPLTIGHPFKGCTDGALASVVVGKPTADLTLAFQAIAKTYDLTPAEVRVLAAIVNIGRVRQVARALGICETTAKSHLQRIFQKTRTHRQADLVKLAATFVSPLA
jgi:DNA-binding CsgD family transcriptional regulator